MGYPAKPPQVTPLDPLETGPLAIPAIGPWSKKITLFESFGIEFFEVLFSINF